MCFRPANKISFNARPHPGLLPRGEGESFAGFGNVVRWRWQGRRRASGRRTMRFPLRLSLAPWERERVAKPGEGCRENEFKVERVRVREVVNTNFVSAQRRQGAKARRKNIPKELRHSARRCRDNGAATLGLSRRSAAKADGESQIEINPDGVVASGSGE